MAARRPSLVNDRRGVSDSLLTPTTSLHATRYMQCDEDACFGLLTFLSRTVVAPPPAAPLQEALAVVTEYVRYRNVS